MYRTFHNYTNLLHNILTSIFSLNFLHKPLVVQFGEACLHTNVHRALGELRIEDLVTGGGTET